MEADEASPSCDKNATIAKHLFVPALHDPAMAGKQ
jgi:hypothetical protein